MSLGAAAAEAASVTKLSVSLRLSQLSMAADWIQTSPGCDINRQGGGCSGVEGEEEEVVVVRKSVVEELLQIQNIQTQTFRCYQQNAN